MKTYSSSNGGGWYSHAPAGNTLASITLPAKSDERWRVDSIIYSLDTAPAAALSLTVQLGDKTVMTVYLPAAGVGQLDFPEKMLQGEPNETVTITISADSGGTATSLTVAAASEHSP